MGTAWTPLAFCETCGYLIYTSTEAHKFCPNPRCRGWIKHILRAGKRRPQVKGEGPGAL